MKPSTGVLADLYSPIQAHLQAVVQIFDDELDAHLPFIEELSAHIRLYRGKMLRPALLLLSAEACRNVTPAHHTLAAVLEMIHLATLVHDDVLDEAQVRRRNPTINALSGNETAVLVGDYLISHAYHLCSSLDSQFASRYVASCTNRVCEGELLQVYNRHNWALTEDEYLRVVTAKTATLTGAACFLGAQFAGAGSDVASALERYGSHTGVAFQIVDDVLDIIGTEHELGKTLGRDLLEGKLTLPVVHFAAGHDPQEVAELRCMTRRPDCRPEIALKLEDSIAYATEVARRRVEVAMEALESVAQGPARDSLLHMAEFILQRRI